MTMHSIFERIVRDMSWEVMQAQQKAAWDTAVEQATLTNPFWMSWAQALRKFASVVPKEIIEEARDMKVALFKAALLKEWHEKDEELKLILLI